MTTRGRVTIPLEIRRRLKIKAGFQVDFEPEPSGGLVMLVRRKHKRHRLAPR
jgi:AbrB family looped-hinge helix DNA binding protein